MIDPADILSEPLKIALAAFDRISRYPNTPAAEMSAEGLRALARQALTEVEAARVLPDKRPGSDAELAKLDGVKAYHLVARHATGAQDAGVMLEAWGQARYGDAAAAIAIPVLPACDEEDPDAKLLIDVQHRVRLLDRDIGHDHRTVRRLLQKLDATGPSEVADCIQSLQWRATLAERRAKRFAKELLNRRAPRPATVLDIPLSGPSTLNGLTAPQRQTLEGAKVLLNTIADLGCESFTDIGQATPNRHLCLRFASEIQDMLEPEKALADMAELTAPTRY